MVSRRPPLRRSGRLRAIALLIATALAAAPAPASAAPAPAAMPDARNLILMIPDGCAPPAIALARMLGGAPLALDSILVGACETASADALITDSASAATAYACGLRTRNRALGLDPERRPVGNLLEAAEARGMRTGLVVTSRVTHATPAAFAAHVPERDDETEIATEELSHHVDVILGGGRSEFLPADSGGLRKDGRDLLREAAARGVTVLRDRAGLARAAALPLLGVFTPDHMSYDIDRDTTVEPALAEMTSRALELLGGGRRGFFLMVEGSRVDHAAHLNDPATLVREVQAFDRAVATALAFARRDGHTLVVAVADHETGGISLGAGEGPDSASALHPERLARVRASAERIAGRIRAGADPAAVLARDAGLDTLTADERAYLALWLPAGRALEKGIARTISRRAGIGWTTFGHTGSDVGIYAFGPGSGRFRGVHRNDEVGRRLAAAGGLDLAAATASLRRAATAQGAGTK